MTTRFQLLSAHTDLNTILLETLTHACRPSDSSRPFPHCTDASLEKASSSSQDLPKEYKSVIPGLEHCRWASLSDYSTVLYCHPMSGHDCHTVQYCFDESSAFCGLLRLIDYYYHTSEYCFYSLLTFLTIHHDLELDCSELHPVSCQRRRLSRHGSRSRHGHGKFWTTQKCPFGTGKSSSFENNSIVLSMQNDA